MNYSSSRRPHNNSSGGGGLRPRPRQRQRQSSKAARNLERLFYSVAVCTACSFLGIVVAWFRLAASDPHLQHDLLDLNKVNNGIGGGSSLLMDSVPRQQTVPFTDSRSCSSSSTSTSSCWMHIPIAVDTLRHLSSPNVTFRPDLHLMTQKGFSDHPNQDRSFLLTSPMNTDPHSILVGLFDGHSVNGHFLADVAATDFAPTLLQNWERLSTLSNSTQTTITEHNDNDNDDALIIRQTLHDTFLQIDQGRRMRQIPQAGCTALAVWKVGTTVYLASAGDSTAFVAMYNHDNATTTTTGTTTILETSRKHKPADADERSRVEARGGKVWIHPTNPAITSRVLIPGHRSALAMSRCFGDWEGKPSGIFIAEPTIKTVDLRDYMNTDNGATNQFFIVVTSDGVVDYMPDLYVAEQVAASLYGPQASASKLANTCYSLVKQASNLWARALNGTYRDDMTIVVSKIVL